MKHTLQLKDFPLQAYDKLRYADTDRQGHVNNSVFSTFLETGRVEFLYQPDLGIITPDTSFVVAALQLDYLQEIIWPGRVDIGTGILKLGNSSIKVLQQIFQNGECAARAETVIVQVSNENGKAQPMSQAAKEIMSRWLVGETQ